MTNETDPLDRRPRSIFELTILTQTPGVVDDLLNTKYDSEEEILRLIRERGYSLGEGSKMEVPQELTRVLSDYDLQRHAVIDEEGQVVAAIGIVKGGADKLSELNRIIEEWQESKADGV